MDEINFEVINTFRDQNTGFIKNIQWVATLPNMPSIMGLFGNSVFAGPSDGFTPFAEVTKEQLVAWIKQDIGPEILADMTNKLRLRREQSMPKPPQGTIAGLPPALIPAVVIPVPTTTEPTPVPLI